MAIIIPCLTSTSGIVVLLKNIRKLKYYLKKKNASKLFARMLTIFFPPQGFGRGQISPLNGAGAGGRGRGHIKRFYINTPLFHWIIPKYAPVMEMLTKHKGLINGLLQDKMIRFAEVHISQTPLDCKTVVFSSNIAYQRPEPHTQVGRVRKIFL